MHDILVFLCGALLCNCVPHLVAGLQGMPFQSPFAKPRGVGESSPLVNFLWGMVNLVAGLIILHDQPVTLGYNLDCLLMLLGALVLGCGIAVHFGKVRRAG